MKIIGVIPARYRSTRFPGKPLADICGRPMIWWVYRQALKVEQFADVFVATDDERIQAVCEQYGMKVVMTSSEHPTGSDRVAEVASKVEGDLFINIQGDEPFIDPLQLSQLKSCFDDPATQIATLVRPFPLEGSVDALANPNSPKVVMDADGFAMLFSRSIIPYLRGVDREEWPSKYQYYTHIGLYAYRAAVLDEITRLPQSPLELAESLEQLRWLQNGYRIKVGVSECRTIGIDTPADLEAARHYLESLSR